MSRLPAELIRQASRLYWRAGLYANRFAADKLSGDPVFAHLFRHGLLNPPAGDGQGATLLDLGCGQALLAACCTVAPSLVQSGHWPADWAAPPRLANYRGIELMAKDARRGQQALQTRTPWITIETGDLRQTVFGQAGVVVLLDVLHYLPHPDHAPLLGRICAALPKGGRLVARIGDAEGGVRSVLARLIDQVVWLGRAHCRNTLHYRSTDDWKALAERAGFRVDSFAPVAGERFGNHLLVASRA